MAFVEKNGTVLCYMPDWAKDDEDIVLTAIHVFPRGEAMQYASDRLRDNPKLIFEAVSAGSPSAFRIASSRLQMDADFVLKCAEVSGYIMKNAAPGLRNNKDVMLCAVKNFGTALEWASDELKKDRELVLAAVRQNGLALFSASISLRDDREVVEAAIRSNSTAYNCIGDTLKDDKELAMLAIRNGKEALPNLGDSLKTDTDIIYELAKHADRGYRADWCLRGLDVSAMEDPVYIALLFSRFTDVKCKYAMSNFFFAISELGKKQRCAVCDAIMWQELDASKRNFINANLRNKRGGASGMKYAISIAVDEHFKRNNDTYKHTQTNNQ